MIAAHNRRKMADLLLKKPKCKEGARESYCRLMQESDVRAERVSRVGAVRVHSACGHVREGSYPTGEGAQFEQSPPTSSSTFLMVKACSS